MKFVAFSPARVEGNVVDGFWLQHNVVLFYVYIKSFFPLAVYIF